MLVAINMEYMADEKAFNLEIFMVVGPAVNKKMILLEYWFKLLKYKIELP
jgi:hypothetical protein